MKTMRIEIALVLCLTFALAAAAAVAGETDLPAESQRIWAPTGDLIGLRSHATGTYQVMDDHGNKAKQAEDWQLAEKHSGSLLFGYHRVLNSSQRYTARGYGTNETGEGLSGRFLIGGASPGILDWDIEYRGFDYFYDRTSEMRSPQFPYPPPPPELDGTPHLNWNRGKIAVGWQVADGFGLSAGFTRTTRNGNKGSLLRSGTGATAPGWKQYASSTNAFFIDADFATGAAAMNLGYEYRSGSGQRDLEGRRTEIDDQKLSRGRLGIQVDAAKNTRILGHGTLSKLRSQPKTYWQSNGATGDGETISRTGQIAWLQRFASVTTLRVSAGFQSHDTKSQTDQTAGVLYATDRDRGRQDYLAALTTTGLSRTRLRFAFRYRDENRKQTTSQDGLPGSDEAGDSQNIDEKKKRYNFRFDGRYRFSRSVKVKADFHWGRYESKPTSTWDTTSGDPWLYQIGVYDRERTNWRIALPMRLGTKVLLDLGHQGIHQTTEREDLPDPTGTAVDTRMKWDATRGYANVNWRATDRFAVYGMVAVGKEKIDLVDSSGPAPGMAPQNYDGTTWRLTPGLNWRFLPKWNVEGMYEFIQFEEKADQSAALNGVKSDHDRILLRVAWDAFNNGTVTATYQRREFDENRWDDTIHDLYAISLSGRF